MLTNLRRWCVSSLAVVLVGCLLSSIVASTCNECAKTKQGESCICAISCPTGTSQEKTDCRRCCYGKYKNSLDARPWYERLFGIQDSYDTKFNSCRQTCDCGTFCIA